MYIPEEHDTFVVTVTLVMTSAAWFSGVAFRLALIPMSAWARIIAAVAWLGLSFVFQQSSSRMWQYVASIPGYLGNDPFDPLVAICIVVIGISGWLGGVAFCSVFAAKSCWIQALAVAFWLFLLLPLARFSFILWASVSSIPHYL